MDPSSLAALFHFLMGTGGFGQAPTGNYPPAGAPPPPVAVPPMMPPAVNETILPMQNTAPMMKDQSTLNGGAPVWAPGVVPGTPQLPAAGGTPYPTDSPYGPDINAPAMVMPPMTALGDALIGNPDEPVASGGAPMDITNRGGAGDSGITDIMKRMAMSQLGVRAPTTPEQPRVSTPNAPQPRPVESKLLQLLAMRQNAAGGNNPLLRLGQALGGR